MALSSFIILCTMTSLNWRLALAWTLQLILAAILVVVVVATLVYGPSYLVSRDGTVEKEARAKAITDTRSTLTTVLGTLAAAFAGIVGYKNYRLALEKQHSDAVATRDKQTAETFSKAVELVGSPEMTKRLGGIYSLRRLIGNSPEDYAAILDVLSGHVRITAAKDPDKPPAPQQETSPGFSRCPVDVQAILNIIGERKFFEQEGEDDRLDLSFIALRDAWCVACNFRRIYFWEVLFENVTLIDADLRDADFRGAVFLNCDFKGAQLKGANFDGASVIKPINLAAQQSAQMHGATFSEADKLGGVA